MSVAVMDMRNRHIKSSAKGTQHCWMLLFASVCTPCCSLLHAVGSCCENIITGQRFGYVRTGLPTLLAQQCWELLRRLIKRSYFFVPSADYDSLPSFIWSDIFQQKWIVLTSMLPLSPFPPDWDFYNQDFGGKMAGYAPVTGETFPHSFWIVVSVLSRTIQVH